MKKRVNLIITVFVIITLSAACSNNEKEVSLTISAAVSLSDALEEIQDLYKSEQPEVSLKFNFGSSGSLQQQISQGAPVDLFFSAAEDKFDLLFEEGRIIEEDRVDLLGNEIVLVVSNGTESLITGFEDLSKNEVSKISIGIPETVPAGKYSKEALENLHLWEKVQSKIVYAKDVRQILSYVETDNVAAGIVYKTDAVISEEVVTVQEAEQSTYREIVYPAGIIKDTENYDAAKDFLDFLQSDSALEVFEEYGFIIK